MATVSRMSVESEDSSSFKEGTVPGEGEEVAVLYMVTTVMVEVLPENSSKARGGSEIVMALMRLCQVLRLSLDLSGSGSRPA